jgi:hypothetical protein
MAVHHRCGRAATAGLCFVNYMPIGRGSDDAKDVVRCARSGDGALECIGN